MKLRVEHFEPGERYSGYVEKLCYLYGFMRVDNATPSVQVFFDAKLCQSFRFNEVKLGDRFRFGIRRSHKYPDKLVVQRLQRETPTTCQEISYKTGQV